MKSKTVVKKVVRKKVITKADQEKNQLLAERKRQEDEKRARELAIKNDPLIQPRQKNYKIGRDLQPKRNLTKYVKWPLYIQLQRKRQVLYKRLKVPPPVNQFLACRVDRQTALQVLRLLNKYKPETKKQKRERLRALAEKHLADKDYVPSARPPVLTSGVNKVTSLVEKKKARLVVIGADVDPVELVLHLPTLCRKMNIPYVILAGGKSRLGAVVGRKTVAAVAITTVNPEDKGSLDKLCEAIDKNYVQKFDEKRKQWGARILSKATQARVAKYQHLREVERNLRADTFKAQAELQAAAQAKAKAVADSAEAEKPAVVEEEKPKGKKAAKKN